MVCMFMVGKSGRLYLAMLDFLEAHVGERLIHQHLLVCLAEGFRQA